MASLFHIITTLIVIVDLQILDGARPWGNKKVREEYPSGISKIKNYHLSTDEKMKHFFRNPQAATIIKASHFSYDFLLGHKIQFICVAKGLPRPHITWFKDGLELSTVQNKHIYETPIGRTKVKSKLEIDPATQGDAGKFSCMANNKHGLDMRSFVASFSIRMV